MKGLLKSRKFWLAVVALLAIVAIEGFGVPEEAANRIAEAIMAVIGVLIIGIAVEDSAKKLNGRK